MDRKPLERRLRRARRAVEEMHTTRGSDGRVRRPGNATVPVEAVAASGPGRAQARENHKLSQTVDEALVRIFSLGLG